MPLLSPATLKLCSRHDLGKLSARANAELPLLETAEPGGPILLDTGVYIHQLKSQAPRTLEKLISLRITNHSSVAIQELLHTVGRLDPGDPRTKDNVAGIMKLVEGVPMHRLLRPDLDVLADAAVYAGILCRLRGYQKDNRKKALSDSTLFLQARKLGLTLVTANVEEFDLLQQMQPEGRVLFYMAT